MPGFTPQHRHSQCFWTKPGTGLSSPPAQAQFAFAQHPGGPVSRATESHPVTLNPWGHSEEHRVLRLLQPRAPAGVPQQGRDTPRPVLSHRRRPWAPQKMWRSFLTPNKSLNTEPTPGLPWLTLLSGTSSHTSTTSEAWDKQQAKLHVSEKVPEATANTGPQGARSEDRGPPGPASQFSLNLFTSIHPQPPQDLKQGLEPGTVVNTSSPRTREAEGRIAGPGGPG